MRLTIVYARYGNAFRSCSVGRGCVITHEISMYFLVGRFFEVQA